MMRRLESESRKMIKLCYVGGIACLFILQPNDNIQGSEHELVVKIKSDSFVMGPPRSESPESILSSNEEDSPDSAMKNRTNHKRYKSVISEENYEDFSTEDMTEREIGMSFSIIRQQLDIILSHIKEPNYIPSRRATWQTTTNQISSEKNQITLANAQRLLITELKNMLHIIITNQKKLEANIDRKLAEKSRELMDSIATLQNQLEAQINRAVKQIIFCMFIMLVTAVILFTDL